MNRILKYAKAWIAAITPVFVIVEAAISDNVITTEEWGRIVVAVVVAVGVLAVPNKHGE